MPVTGAAASRRARGVGSRRFCDDRNTRKAPEPTRKLKKRAPSNRKLPEGKQKSFRKMMSDSMQEWKSAPTLNFDQSSGSAVTGSLRSLVPLPQESFRNKDQQSKKKKSKSKRGKCWFTLSRGSSDETHGTHGTHESVDSIADVSLVRQPTRPLSPCFPVAGGAPEKYLIRRPTAKGEIATIENQEGEVVGIVEETHFGRRLLKDKDNKVCAMILMHQERYSPNSFSICGLKPIVPKQSMKFDQVGLGYYKWAHVSNTGGVGGVVSLKHIKDETKPSEYTFRTKMFGSVFRLKKARGHLVLDERRKQCAKIVNLPNTGRAVQVATGQDVAMMLCYSVIIDAILETRMR